MDLDEKLLETALNMPVAEMHALEKIKIQVDTSNSHLQRVGEILESVIHLNLNDSIIRSV